MGLGFDGKTPPSSPRERPCPAHVPAPHLDAEDETRGSSQSGTQAEEPGLSCE